MFSFFLVLIYSCKQEVENQETWRVSDGYVPDSATAVKISEVIFVRIYGDKVLESKPFSAKLKEGNIWIVEGTLAKNIDGGVPYAEIQKNDGKILKISHGK